MGGRILYMSNESATPVQLHSNVSKPWALDTYPTLPYGIYKHYIPTVVYQFAYQQRRHDGLVRYVRETPCYLIHTQEPTSEDTERHSVT